MTKAEWKKRAKDAERELKATRKALRIALEHSLRQPELPPLTDVPPLRLPHEWTWVRDTSGRLEWPYQARSMGGVSYGTRAQ